VTTEVRDEATNFLDQDASVASNQPKTWKFAVKPSDTLPGRPGREGIGTSSSDPFRRVPL
jgi:hypothetical protein